MLIIFLKWIFVDGKWSSWTSWTSCSADCGGGGKTRIRDCTNPKPAYGGRFCAGYNSDVATCNDQPCSYGEFAIKKEITTQSKNWNKVNNSSSLCYLDFGIFKKNRNLWANHKQSCHNNHKQTGTTFLLFLKITKVQ